MYNYDYRDYQPETARFTTVDPIRDGNNWFAYVNNDPVNYVDPLGLQCISANDPKNN
jgi:RHS repeat-associated protein